MKDSSVGSMTWTMFLTVVLIGGGNFVAVRVSNSELAPFWGAGLRFSLAALIFVAAALALRLKWPRYRHLGLLALYGLFSFTLSYALMYWALVRLSAGMAAVVLAVVPLITPLLAVAHRMGSLEGRSVAGAGVALVGILIMTLGPGGFSIPLSSLIAVTVAALAVGESVIISKKVSVEHPAMSNAVGMPLGAVGLLVISLAAGESWALPSQTEVIWSVTYLATVGSVGLFVLFLLVARRWTPAAISYAFVIFPVVTLLLEAALLDEPLTLRSMIGAAVVMGGVWWGALAPDRTRRSAEAVAAAGEASATSA